MKITETIERECCEQVDRRPYRGLRGLYGLEVKMEFCVHCGQLWSKTKYTNDGTEARSYLAWETVRGSPKEKPCPSISEITNMKGEGAKE